MEAILLKLLHVFSWGGLLLIRCIFMFSFWLLASDLRLAGAMHLPSLHQHRPGVILVAIMDFKVGIISVFVSVLPLFKWRNAPVCVWLCFEDYTGFIKMHANKPQIANQTLTVLSFSVILESLILPQSFDRRVFFIVKSRFVWFLRALSTPGCSILVLYQ